MVSMAPYAMTVDIAGTFFFEIEGLKTATKMKLQTCLGYHMYEIITTFCFSIYIKVKCLEDSEKLLGERVLAKS
jgi:hypothetical protein